MQVMSGLDIDSKVAVVTNMPVHYQVDLFNAITALGEINLRVYYLRKQSYGRHWKFPENIAHDAVFIPELRVHKHLYLSPGAYGALSSWKSDLTVICQYASVAMQAIMWSYSMLGRPWVFWSERPSIIGYLEDPIVSPAWLRYIFRSIAMFPVKAWSTAIWGIGTTACSIYEKLTRGSIKCVNYPYSSDLSAFLAIKRIANPEPPVRFLFSGSLTQRKGFDTLIQAVEQLCEREDNFEVYVAGKGEMEDILVALPNSVRKHFHLLGFKQREEMPDVYASCDALVFPSRYDGWGMSVVEAMASGMPVIGSASSGACVDLIEDGIDGFLIEPDDPRRLRNRMSDLIRNPARIRAMGDEARKKAILMDVRYGGRKFIELSRLALQGRR